MSGPDPRNAPAGELPSREDVLRFVEESPGRVGKREIARAFGVKGSNRIGLKRLLNDMADDGLIAPSGSRLRRAGSLPSVAVLNVESVDDDGLLVAHPANWDTSEGPPPRVLIEPAAGRKPRGPAPGVGDRVLARITKHPGVHRARVMKVLDKNPGRTIGVHRNGRILPVNRKHNELVLAEGSAAEDALVAVELLDRAKLGPPRARILEEIGDVSSERAISLIALEEHGIPYVFPPSVLREAKEVEPVGTREREDWRDLPLVTIDPADARDHDDAVHAAPDPDAEGGMIVTVAIADVSAYVRPGSAMDREARKRGNSVYFPGRVVPMLPERISNDLCSLRENEDRPAIAVRMRFDAQGVKRGHRFHRVTMRSHAKLSYQQAQAAIEGNGDKTTKALLDDVLTPLWRAYRLLSKQRDKRQPLEIDVPERRVVLNEAGGVESVQVPPRLDAHKLIEEFMIQANVCAAETLEERDAPVVYRIHDQPSGDKLDGLRDFLSSLNIPFPKSGAMRPKQFNGILARVRGEDNALLVNEVVLRSQSQAEYNVENIGHFGLNLRRYAHFTSPIRRYADLLVHRSLIASLGLGSGGLGDEADKLAKIAGDISNAERRAMLAERDTLDRLIARYLADHVGATFTGRIRGVVKSGLFVELDETGADGYVPAATLGRDYYVYEEAAHALIGRESGETFRLGDTVEVKLVEALPVAGALRFEMLSEGRAGRAPKAAGRRVQDKRAPREKRGKRRKGR